MISKRNVFILTLGFFVFSGVFFVAHKARALDCRTVLEGNEIVKTYNAIIETLT